MYLPGLEISPSEFIWRLRGRCHKIGWEICCLFNFHTKLHENQMFLNRMDEMKNKITTQIIYTDWCKTERGKLSSYLLQKLEFAQYQTKQ